MSNVSVRVLYTQYSGSSKNSVTGVAELENSQTQPKDIDTSKNISYGNIKAIKPMLETYLGLGWGRYICDEGYHIDFAAGWDFDILRISKNSPAGSGNLGLTGFNFKFRFDF